MFSLCLLFSTLPIHASTIHVDSWDVSVEYGERSRGDVFTDTLQFVGPGDTPLIATEADPTCDCLTADVLEDGRVVIRFEVLPEELDGPTEKLLYVFTDHSELDLLRVKLKLTVLPGGYDTGTSQDDVDYLGDSEHTFADSTIAGVIDLVFYHSPSCRICARIDEITLSRLQELWGESLVIHHIDLNDQVGFMRLLETREHYGITESHGSFLIVVGDYVFQSTDQLYARLYHAVGNSLCSGSSTFMPTASADHPDTDTVRDLLQSFSFWTVAGAGLLDGLNPCAFATIVFFISLLSYAGSTKRQILIVGSGFTFSVFVVYLLLGLGAFRALQALSAYTIIGDIVWGLTVLLLVVLVALSLRDTIQFYRTGQTRDAFLQLPRSSKQKIHAAMRRGLKTPNLLLAAIGIGVTVTLFEAACTGQVYLPAIVLMLNDPLLSERAWLWLIVYNLLFIAPLLVIFALSYIGISSSSYANWSKHNYGKIRIALTLLFVLFLALLLVQRF